MRLKIGKDTSTPYEEVDASSSRGKLLLADTKAPTKVVTVSISVFDFIIVMNYFMAGDQQQYSPEQTT